MASSGTPNVSGPMSSMFTEGVLSVISTEEHADKLTQQQLDIEQAAIAAAAAAAAATAEASAATAAASAVEAASADADVGLRETTSSQIKVFGWKHDVGGVRVLVQVRVEVRPGDIDGGSDAGSRT